MVIYFAWDWCLCVAVLIWNYSFIIYYNTIRLYIKSWYLVITLRFPHYLTILLTIRHYPTNIKPCMTISVYRQNTWNCNLRVRPWDQTEMTITTNSRLENNNHSRSTNKGLILRMSKNSHLHSCIYLTSNSSSPKSMITKVVPCLATDCISEECNKTIWRDLKLVIQHITKSDPMYSLKHLISY